MSKIKKRSRKSQTSLYSIGRLSVLLGLLVLFLDQASKYWVHTSIPRMGMGSYWYPYKGIEIAEDFFGMEFSIVHAINRGAAWGIFADFQDYLLIVRMIFISAIIVYLFFYNRNRAFTLPLTLIVVGALGNIIDYFVYGHVIDMIKCVFWGYHYPVFNIADSAIFVGVCSMIILSTVNKKNKLLSNA